MNLIPIKDHPTLVRDPNSKAILNTDMSKLTAYENQKRRMDLATRAIEEVTELRNEINQIKQLLIEIINKPS